MDAFAALTAATDRYNADPTEENRIAVLCADDRARFEAGLEVIL